jgi:hypothetical protein
LTTAAGALAREAAGQDDVDSEARDCVELMRIDRTEVVDDDTVLFYMRNGEIYRNDLRSSCPTLEFEQRFMYRTFSSRLCEIDAITVIDDVGFGFVPIASCGLGKFEPIAETMAEDLSARAEQQESSDGDGRSQ